MSEHPTPSELDGFMRGSLPPERMAAVIAHLLPGCVECHARLAPIAEWLLAGAGEEQEPPLAEAGPAIADLEPTAEHEAAIDRAMTAALQHARLLDREREATPGNLAPLVAALSAGIPGAAATWPLCERLLERAFALRHDDPASMLRLTGYAMIVAEGLRIDRYGARLVADYRARVWAELANAHRVNDDLHSAEATMAKAERWRARGTGDDLLHARLLELTASLRADQRRFTEADAILREVQSTHESFGDLHAAGRASIKRAGYAGYEGRLDEAVALFEAGLVLIDREHDSSLTLSALDGLLRCSIELGRFREARKLLWHNRGFLASGSRINMLKMRWHEGEIAAGLGKLDRAEVAFRQVREGFEAVGKAYYVAIVTLDLATVLAQRGETSEAVRLTEEALAAFRALDIERETYGALSLLAHIVRREAEQGSPAALLSFLRGAVTMLKRGR